MSWARVGFDGPRESQKQAIKGSDPGHESINGARQSTARQAQARANPQAGARWARRPNFSLFSWPGSLGSTPVGNKVLPPPVFETSRNIARRGTLGTPPATCCPRPVDIARTPWQETCHRWDLPPFYTVGTWWVRIGKRVLSSDDDLRGFSWGQGPASTASLT